MALHPGGALRRLVARGALLAFFPLCAAPALAEPIGREGARHLLNRAGFGAAPAEIESFAGLSREQAVERILSGARREARLAPPKFVDEPFTPYRKLRTLSAEELQREQRRNIEQGLQLREWWMREMLLTDSPLTERMTLFWHNHFATSQQKVRVAALMYRQNALLRSEALGNFGTLLRGIARDPAMLVYLDNAGSRRQAPNENFARELMELFTLGEGRYSEKDVKEAARAFTGWSLDPDAATFVHRRFWHDAGEKTVLGRTGRLDGDQVLEILLARPETAEFLAGKLWREFVSPEPEPAELGRLASVLRDANYELKPLLRAMFSSRAFWAGANRAALVKSPVDLVVGTLRTFEIHPFSLVPAAVASAVLGQNLFSPPNVKGWPGGEAWINSATLLARRQFLERLFRGSDAMPAPSEGPASGPESRWRRMMERGMATYAFDWERWSRPFPTGADGRRRIEQLALATGAVNPVPPEAEGIEWVRHLVSDPAYQLR